MTNLFLPALRWFAERQKDNFVRKTRNPLPEQENYLLNLLRDYQNTELGQKYGLKDIKTIDRFRDRVPVLPYQSYEPYIRRIAKGEPNILTPDPVVYLNTTSGSTGTQKLIPVTQRFQSSLGRVNITSIGFLSSALRSRGLKFGHLLATNAAKAPKRTEGGINYGSAGPGVLHMRKYIYEQLFAHPFDTLKVTDSLARHYVCLLFSLRDRNLRGIGSNFPMLILRICTYLERYAEDLIADLERGTLPPWIDLEPALQAKLERRLTPAPKRAAQLCQLLKSHGRLTPALAWQNLSYIAAARGGTSDFYFDRFSDYFDNTPGFGAVFATAEGTFSVYPDLDTDGSVLAVDTGFFEFVPESEWDKDHPQTLLANEVQPGQLYRILMTNYSGFYRYDIGDVIEVSGFYENTPTIVFRHRRGGLLSSTTEKTTESDAVATLHALQQEFHLHLEDFCITLSEHDFPARYVLNIELAPGETLSDTKGFLRHFEKTLIRMNPYYGVKRNDGQIPCPRLRILAPGSFDIVRQRQVERGIPDFQLKFPHISEDRSLVEGLTVVDEVRLPEEMEES